MVVNGQYNNFVHAVKELQASSIKKSDLVENESLYTTDEKFKIFPMIDNGDLAGLRELQAKGVDFTKENAYAMVYSAHKGQTDILKYFVEEVGISVQSDNYNAVRYAITMNQDEPAKYLISKNLPQDVVALGLGEASLQGNTPLIEHLVSKFKFTDDQLDIAFAMACVNERKESALVLYSIADENLQSRMDKTLFNWASWRNGTTLKAETDVAEVKDSLQKVSTQRPTSTLKR